MWLCKKLFNDKRCTIALVLVWMVTVCTIFYVLGAFHMAYMHVGPGEQTVFMGLKIDSWGKWTALAVFSFCNTCINEFISNALDPWFLNSLQVCAALLCVRCSQSCWGSVLCAGPQDKEHRVLPCDLPVDCADPLHVRPRHGRFFALPLLQPG